jgi:hypothetical protein
MSVNSDVHHSYTCLVLGAIIRKSQTMLLPNNV